MQSVQECVQKSFLFIGCDCFHFVVITRIFLNVFCIIPKMYACVAMTYVFKSVLYCSSESFTSCLILKTTCLLSPVSLLLNPRGRSQSGAEQARPWLLCLYASSHSSCSSPWLSTLGSPLCMALIA